MSDCEKTQGQAIDELGKIKRDYVDKTYKWYKNNVSRPRYLFRGAGIAVIVLSLGIPFLAAAGGRLLEIGVPVASFMIAVLAGLNSFFAWQATWQKRVTIQLTLRGLMATWEIKIAAARRNENQEEGYRLALEATQDLVERTRSLDVGKTSVLFASIKFPEKRSGDSEPPQSHTP